MKLSVVRCYKALGLSPSATKDEVRCRYRQLARQMHPDLHPDNPVLAQRFQEITSAYNHLLGRSPIRKSETASRRQTPAPKTNHQDPAAAAKAWAEWRRRAESARVELKSKDDEAAATAAAACQVAPPPPEANNSPNREDTKPPNPPRPEVNNSPNRIDEKERWGQRVRARFTRMLRRKRGEDITMTLSVDMATILVGCTRHIAIERDATCPCTGDHTVSCACDGTGRIRVREKVKVVIPPGARPGAKLRLAGKGTGGVDGESSGDLYLLLQPVEFQGYRRDDADLYGTLAVHTRQLQGGTTLHVKAPLGKVRVDVAPGTRRGEKLCVPGGGLPRWGAVGRGDLYLVVEPLA